MTKPTKAGKEIKVTKATKKVEERCSRLAVFIARQLLYVAVKSVIQDLKAAAITTMPSAFEQVRQQNILKNKEFLRNLGICDDREEIAVEKATKDSAAVAGMMPEKQFWLSVGMPF